MQYNISFQHDTKVEKKDNIMKNKLFFLVFLSNFEFRESLKTQNSRLATKTKVEFTKVNEHFDEET